MVPTFFHGEVAEWSKAQHWKCCVPQGTVGSNPTLSAILRVVGKARDTLFIQGDSKQNGGSDFTHTSS